jgi:ribose-phosphate pyrophosphokinase
MDLHAAQIQGFFDVPVDHLNASPVLNKYFLDLGLNQDAIVVVSPDEGSIKRAITHSKKLGGTLAIIDKRRSSATETKQENIIGGPIEGRVALIFDDLISTAGSVCGAARLVREAGAKEIYVAASHGIFCDQAIERIENAPISTVVVTDSIPASVHDQCSKIQVLSIASLLAEAIKRIHQNQSVSAMFNEKQPG